MSLEEDETPGVAGYTMDDIIIYEVSTLGFTTDGESTLTYTKEEGYSMSTVTITPSDDVVSAYVRKFGEDDILPTKENYLDEFTEYLDTYFDPTDNISFDVTINNYEFSTGSNNKIAVILVDEEGRSSLHIIDLSLLPIPVSSEPLTVTFGDYTYDPIDKIMYAEITEWPEDADIYYNFTSHTSVLTGDELVDAQCDILEGPFNYKRVTDADIDEGVIYLEKTQTQNKYMAQTRTLHVIIVKDGKIGSDNCVKFTIPQLTN